MAIIVLFFIAVSAISLAVFLKGMEPIKWEKSWEEKQDADNLLVLGGNDSLNSAGNLPSWRDYIPQEQRRHNYVLPGVTGPRSRESVTYKAKGKRNKPPGHEQVGAQSISGHERVGKVPLRGGELSQSLHVPGNEEYGSYNRSTSVGKSGNSQQFHAPVGGGVNYGIPRIPVGGRDWSRAEMSLGQRLPRQDRVELPLPGVQGKQDGALTVVDFGIPAKMQEVVESSPVAARADVDVEFAVPNKYILKLSSLVCSKDCSGPTWIHPLYHCACGAVNGILTAFAAEKKAKQGGKNS